jgi:carbonic anhydrase
MAGASKPSRKRTAGKVKVSRPADIPRGSGKSDLSFCAGSEYFPDIHTLIADELLISGNYYIDSDGPHFAPDQMGRRSAQSEVESIQRKTLDMVARPMHESRDGKIAGVAVLLKAGSANSTVPSFGNICPKTRGKEEVIAGVEVNLAGLLPRDTSYYACMGSLTAPPCTEGVTWFVRRTAMDISREEISAFAALYPQDVRPPQLLNGRVVKESQSRENPR